MLDSVGDFDAGLGLCLPLIHTLLGLTRPSRVALATLRFVTGEYGGDIVAALLIIGEWELLSEVVKLKLVYEQRI